MSFSTSASFSKFGKNKHYDHDSMQYNRAELMRMQQEGVEIIIGPNPKSKKTVKPKPIKNLNPPTVTIKNLNIVTNENDVNDDNKDDSKDKTEENDNNKDQKEYEFKEDIKKIEIRHDHNWFVMKFENNNEFYQFLDRFMIFGLLAEDDGVLIITNYDDLIGENKKYRTVKFTQFDRWSPLRIEQKVDKFKKFYSDSNSIKKKGVCTKNEKTIGVRHNYVWLQLTFRFKWEFDKFLWDSKCYGLVDEHSSLIIRKYKDLEQSDYRLLNVNNWDQYNAADLDGTYSASVMIDNTNNKGGGKKNKKTKNSNSSTSWW